VEGAHEKGFDDTGWESRTLPIAWDPTHGDCWLRFKLVVPDRVSGIDVAGSKIEIASGIMTVGAEVFVDGDLVLKEGYWTDFRGPRIILTQKAVPGDTHVVAIRAFNLLPISKGAKAGIPRIDLAYESVERIAFEIDSFCEELDFATILPKGKNLVKRVSREFDSDAIAKGSEPLLREIEAARSKLSVLTKYAKQFKVHLIAHSHIDMNWLWPWQDTFRVVQRDFSTITSLMDRYPDLHFSHSQVATYKATEDSDPELFERVKQKVKSGNWDVTAATWVEADLNMGGTEAMVRQILYAKRYIEEKLGFESRVCWEPDTFGHPATLPQILRQGNLPYYYHMRCGKGYPMYWWEGPDGSKVLAFNSVYNNTVTPANLVQVAKEFYRTYGLRTSMFVYGVGDHGGGPTVEDINAAHLIQAKPTLPDATLSSTHSYFDEISKQKPKLPTVKGELNFIFDGCYTTHGDIKRYNRKCERLLVDAEKLSAMAGLSPKKELLEAWRKMLFNQFHDILDGSAVGETYVHAAETAQQVIETADGITRDSVSKIAQSVKLSSSGLPIIVFNTLSWDRKDVVRVKVAKDLIPGHPHVVDAQGRESAVQVDGGTLIFIAEVPSLGYNTYYLSEGEQGDRALVSDKLVLENDTLRAELDGKSGAVKGLYDKQNGRLVIKSPREEATMSVMSNLLQVLYEAPVGMSAWVIGQISRIENLLEGARIEILDRGPVRARVRVTHEHGRSKIVQDTTIYSGIPRIDFQTSIDWGEIGNEETEAPMLKASFTPLLGATQATFEVPFGHVIRPADGREVPALRWIDLSDNTYGVSLLNDSKYGFDVSGNTMRITLVRSGYNPDPTPDLGKHEILYSLYPHKGDWKKGMVFRRGYEINHPLE
ncbi:MAG TPA: glycoside hydrolase family 38 C-terminal domain-containing protein, partial [Thermoproteota archaeon]|nr:glycoside hydrolase family 38 C-terminal domain-containing protein [Thermoproteota archaeon]